MFKTMLFDATPKKTARILTKRDELRERVFEMASESNKEGKAIPRLQELMMRHAEAGTLAIAHPSIGGLSIKDRDGNSTLNLRTLAGMSHELLGLDLIQNHRNITLEEATYIISNQPKIALYMHKNFDQLKILNPTFERPAFRGFDVKAGEFATDGDLKRVRKLKRNRPKGSMTALEY